MTERLYATLSVKHRLVGCALLRIALGGVALYYLLGHWSQHALLWGPNGLYPLWLFQREQAVTHAPSLFAVAAPRAFEALYAAAIVCSALYMVGWRTRWIQWPFALLFWSVLMRNPFMLTGGDNLVQVVLPFLMWVDTAAVLSLDARRRAAVTPTGRPFASLLHNFALGCTIVQLCIMYTASGLAKVAGHPWQHGTAIYYVLRTQEFGLPPFNDLVFRNPTLVTLLTYGVMAFEIGFPALIIARSTRWLATLGAVLLHVGIGVIMGLVPFATEALMFQFLLYDDASYAPLLRARHT